MANGQQEALSIPISDNFHHLRTIYLYEGTAGVPGLRLGKDYRCSGQDIEIAINNSQTVISIKS